MAGLNFNLKKQNGDRLLFNSPSTAKNNNKHQNDKYFEIGDYVFAKIKGHSAWPAKVNIIFLPTYRIILTDIKHCE
jgi:hypothetical protein